MTKKNNILFILDIYLDFKLNKNNENIKLFLNREKFYNDLFEYIEESKFNKNDFIEIKNIIDKKLKENKNNNDLILEFENYTNKNINEIENEFEIQFKNTNIHSLLFYLNYIKYFKKNQLIIKEKMFEFTYDLNWFDPISFGFKYLYLKYEKDFKL